VGAVRSLEMVSDWPADHVALAVIGTTGAALAEHGDQGRPFRLASVTKLLTAYATLIAVEEGAIEWDQPAGPPGATVRHLVAHASGLAFDEQRSQAPPATRRIYSNAGFAVLAATIVDATGMDFSDYLSQAVLAPLEMSSTWLDRSVTAAAGGAVSTAADLARFVAELQAPTLVAEPTLATARRVAYPELDGVLPGFGTQRPNDWGLGFEIRGAKHPHWTGSHSSPDTFGHFGQSGTFCWVDPDAGAAAVVLTDRDFGPWAMQAWPAFTDQLLADLATLATR
jgi:CubicO group peptidase (beta-lactamase class C family)